MALETPNAIVAAAVLRFDNDSPPGDRFTLLSSNGILGKIQDTIAAGAPMAAFALQTPIPADEGVVLMQNHFVGFDFVDLYPIGFIKAEPINTAEIDDLPLHSLVNQLVASAPSGPVRYSFSVMHVPLG
jgi:hypothetical protein